MSQFQRLVIRLLYQILHVLVSGGPSFLDQREKESVETLKKDCRTFLQADRVGHL
jgi:hypothetical protein